MDIPMVSNGLIWCITALLYYISSPVGTIRRKNVEI